MRDLLRLAHCKGFELSLWTCENSMYLTVTRDQDGKEATFSAQKVSGISWAEMYASVETPMHRYLQNQIALRDNDGETTE